MFSQPPADWWARLGTSASIETLLEYWKNQVDAFYDPGDGTVTVRVRAFTAPDALRLAQAVLAACRHLVDDLSIEARRDRLRNAEAEVEMAKTRLAAALAKIRDFRERKGLIDPAKTAAESAALATRVRDDLVRARAERSTLKTYMRDDAPSVRVVEARIRSLETQLRAVDAGVAAADTGGGPPLSQAMASYDALESERKFAEFAYQHALEQLDQARLNADQHQVYIASFVPPTLPEEALYPRRWRSLGVVALIAFAVWAIGGLAVQSVRDHL
jgi:capsular polysaccharide transport system permease protein